MSSDDFERSSGNNTDDELDSPSRRNYDNSSKRRKSKSKQIPIKKGHSRSSSSELHARPSVENFSKHMSHVHKIETFTQLHSSHSPQDGIIDPKLLDKAEDVVEQSSSAPEPSIIPLQVSTQNAKSNIKSVRRVLSDRKIRFSETKSDTDQEAARDLRSDSSSDKGSPPKFDRDMMFYSQHDEEISEDVQVLEYVDVHVKSLEEKFGMHKAVQMYVNFLQEVYTDIDEESIPKTVERYQKWLFMKSKRPEKLLYMPLDVLFIFSVHITFLSSWDKLSQTLFGKLRKPSDLGRRDENLLRPTNRKWLRYYGEPLYKSPYWESSSHDLRAEFPNEWKLNIDMDLIAAAKDRLMFLRRLESELDLNQLTSKVFYKQSKKQYQEFLFKLYHPNTAQNLRAPIDSEDEDEDEDDVRLASRRKRGQNNDTNIEMKPISPRDKVTEASSSDGEVSLSNPISPRDASSRSSSQGKLFGSDPLALMIKCAGGIEDVRPKSAVTELFWQTHLQNPKRYRKDLRALAKLAELLEEEKAKERRMFERRKRERDNMQRKSQERKRGESDRESDDLKSKKKHSNESSKKSGREVMSQQSHKKSNRVNSSGSGLESLKSSVKSPTDSRHSLNSGHNRDRDDHRSGHHSSRRNGNSHASHHSRRQIQNDDSDEDIESGRQSMDFDETDDILVAAVSSKKVKSELVKRRALIRTLGTVLFVITISIALGILVALAVGVSRGPIAQDWMALGIFGMVICVFTTMFGLFICLCPQRINIFV
eukprot:TRINITY_DN1978_c0_g1_i1.p1 TRINITY_DN1978_c0_g1~~TRINITY_DN1978_c0_g1_i1.p1  ORF type:complete len:762 (-),score=156.09 TRINITY_DN1978_c0_g1_i1:29-2314(-)